MKDIEKIKYTILTNFPEALIKAMSNVNFEKIEEIRIRVNRPVILNMGQNEIIVKYQVDSAELLNILQSFCSNSIYTYQTQICSGFITIPGGHRVGISGTVVIKNGQITNISNFYSLNIRVAKEIPNCSMEILPYVIDSENNSIFNTLIVSPPGAGKTTILRDITNKISNGIQDINFRGINVTVVDERGEIAAVHRGVPQNDVGTRTDVLDNIPKTLGIPMAIRSLAPRVIIADEIGSKNDSEVINYAICSGVKCIFSAHGKTIQDLKYNPEISKLINQNIFERIIILDSNYKGKIKYKYINSPKNNF